MNWGLISAMAMVLLPVIAIAIWATWYYRDVLFENKKYR